MKIMKRQAKQQLNQEALLKHFPIEAEDSISSIEVLKVLLEHSQFLNQFFHSCRINRIFFRKKKSIQFITRWRWLVRRGRPTKQNTELGTASARTTEF